MREQLGATQRISQSVLESKWPTNLLASAYIDSCGKPTEVLRGFRVWIVGSRSVRSLNELLGKGTNRDSENPQGAKNKIMSDKG